MLIESTIEDARKYVLQVIDNDGSYLCSKLDKRRPPYKATMQLLDEGIINVLQENEFMVLVEKS